MIYGNLSLLTSAIENIVRNALKYTKDRIFLTINLQKMNRMRTAYKFEWMIMA